MSVEEIGNAFLKAYYTAFDSYTDNSERAKAVESFYHEMAQMTFQRKQCLGKGSIIENIKNLQFKTIQRQLSDVDCQQTPQGIIILVSGQMQADEEKVMGYKHFFLLTQFDNAYLITNEIFGLVLHDIAVQQ